MRIFPLMAAALLVACQQTPPTDQRADGKDAPLGAMLDPASAGSATEVATDYAAAIGAGRLGEAFALLAPGSEAAAGGARTFANRFTGRDGVTVTIGKAGDPVDGKVQDLVEVPAVVSGTDRLGKAFRVEGPILLRVADRSATPDVPPRWEIVRAPFPA